MLESINHLHRIYESEKKIVPKIIFPEPPAGCFYELKRIVTKYEGQKLKHFGIFQNDTLVFDLFNQIQCTERDSLYLVQLPNKSIRVCAVLFKGHKTTLHDGRGENFRSYPTSILKLIGVLNEIRKAEKII